MTELKPRHRRRRRAATVAAAFLLLAGAGLGAAGGAQAADGGYFSTSYHRFSTTTAALKSDEIEVGPDRAHAADPNPDLGEVARVRIVIRPADPSVPVFVGIGPKAQVESYLRGTASTSLTEQLPISPAPESALGNLEPLASRDVITAWQRSDAHPRRAGTAMQKCHESMQRRVDPGREREIFG